MIILCSPQISIKDGPRTTHCIVRTPQKVYRFVGYTYEKKITNRGHERAHQCGTSWLLMIFFSWLLGLRVYRIFACRGTLLRPSGDTSSRKLPQHPTNKTVQFPGCDWVFVMSIAPDGAIIFLSFCKVLILGHGGSYRGTCSLPGGGRPKLFALAPHRQNGV